MVVNNRRKEPHSRASASEISEFRSVCGSLLWLGKGVLPPAVYRNSVIQQIIRDHCVAHLLEASDIVRGIRKLHPSILYPDCHHIINAVVSPFSDASFNTTSRKSYGQTGLVQGIRVKLPNENNRFHVLD